MRLYRAPGAWFLLACEDAVPVGVIGVRAQQQGLTIAHIEVAPRGISAETDDDAVDSYRACGFEIETISVRYRCRLGTMSPEQ